MSLYRFVKGGGGSSRLFVQGTREGGDRDDVNGGAVPHDDIGSLQALYTRRRLNTEVFGSTVESTKTSRRPSSGTRCVTTRIVKKTTTLTRGEERTVTESLLQRAGEQPLVQVEERVVRQPALQAKRAKVHLLSSYFQIILGRGVVKVTKNLKIKIYKTLMLPVVLFRCEAWSLTLSEIGRASCRERV